MNIIKKSDLMEFVSEKKQMLLGRKMEGSAEPAVAPPKTKPKTTPKKYPRPYENPKPKASAEPDVAPPKTKPKTTPKKYPNPYENPGTKAGLKGLDGEMKVSKKVKLNKKYPKKFVKEHINSYFCVDILNETINEDYSVELLLVGNKSELVKCLKNLKEGNVIN